MTEPKIDLSEMAQDATEAAETLGRHWYTVLKGLGVLMAGAITLSAVEGIWSQRVNIAVSLFERLTKDAPGAPHLATPWTSLHPLVFPDFWVCDSSGCDPDTTKQDKIEGILQEYKSKLGGIRMTFSVYGPGYRRIALTTQAPGQDPIPEAYWMVPLNQPGYTENYVNHLKLLCNQIVPETLPEGSLLHQGASKLSVGVIVNCPTLDGQTVTGYLSVDYLEGQPIPDIDSIQQLLRKAALEVSRAMGWETL
jgi:hypothetical protein